MAGSHDHHAPPMTAAAGIPSAPTVHQDGGHDRHAGHSVEMFRRRFFVSLALTIPILAWGHMLRSALGWEPPVFPGSAFIPPVLGTLVFLYGGRPFLQGAVREIRSRRPRNDDPHRPGRSPSPLSSAWW